MSQRFGSSLVVIALAGVLALSGCSALGIERADDSPTSSRASGSGSGSTPSTPVSPNPSGPDATPPADGVGGLTVGQVDRWELTNGDDNIVAAYLTTPDAPQLGAAQQAQVGLWVAEYRAMQAAAADRDTGTSSPPDSSPPDSSPGAASPTASPSTVTQAGPATSATVPEPGDKAPTSAPTEPASASTDSASTDSTSPTSTSPAPTPAPRTPGGSGPDEQSLRIVPQLLSTDRVVGVRLYARISDGDVVREHVRTFWADSATGEPVPATGLFTAGRVSEVRRLVLAEPGGSTAGALSDEDLFGAAAFSVEGDLVLYLPEPGASDTRVVVEGSQLAPLLSELGQGARASARDAVVPEPSSTTSPRGSAGSASATPTP